MDDFMWSSGKINLFFNNFGIWTVWEIGILTERKRTIKLLFKIAGVYSYVQLADVHKKYYKAYLQAKVHRQVDHPW